MSDVDLDWLRTLIAVVDYGGFTAASEHIHRSQSRVSAHIAALEHDLGVVLIDRSRRPPVLTYVGEVYVKHARATLADLDAAESAVRALRGLGAGDITLLTTPCIGAGFLPPVLAELTRQHPGTKITLIEQSSQDLDWRFLADGIVFAVLGAPAPMPPAGLRRKALWREPIHAVVDPEHRLARSRVPVTTAMLAGESLIVPGRSGDTESEILRLLTESGIAHAISITVDAPQTLMALARHRLGVGVMTAAAAAMCSTEDVVVLDIVDPGLSVEVAAYWYDVLLSTEIGRTLHKAVLTAAAPAGVQPILDEIAE